MMRLMKSKVKFQIKHLKTLLLKDSEIFRKNVLRNFKVNFN